jgi:hypothetical protein
MAAHKIIQNHIIIGLGGTGGNTIKKFRQQIVDKFGDINGVDALNNIKFLYVDSNTSEFDEEKWEYQGKNLMLTGKETLVLKAGILTEKLNDYSSRPEFLGENSEWGDIIGDKELAKKAGNQMRRLGRVNLIPNIIDIVDIVSKNENALSNARIAETLIHIVAGLAGGTGSGSVVDVTSHLLKYFEKRSNSVKINLYLKLPEVQIPQGWGGQFTGPLKNVSFYKINGYAALKEVNGLASGIFHPYDITKKRERITTKNLLQASYLFTERNNSGIGFTDVITPIASLLFLKTITSDSEKENTDEMSLPQVLNKVDNGENETILPSTYWGLAGKFRVPGIYKIGVPKVQIRESFAHLLVLHAFNKTLYKNFDAQGGKGFLGNKPNVDEAQKEKNTIITNLRSALLDEWYLTYEYLILDEPMVDERNILLTKGKDDYSFKLAYKKEYSSQYTKLAATKQYKGKFIDDKEILKYLQIGINDYFNKDYKGVGYENYYSDMLNNLDQLSDFIALRIKDKMFGKEGGEISRYYPMESYINFLLCIAQEYMDGLERDMKNKQLEYKKLVEKKHVELKTINEEYINNFGIFGSAKKREVAVGNFNAALESFWKYTVELKGITFAIQLIHSNLKSKLLSLKTEIENDITQMVKRRDVLNQEYLIEKNKLGGKESINGFRAITNDEGLEKFQMALMKNRPMFEAVIQKLEKLIFEQKNNVCKSVEDFGNKNLSVMKQAYKEIDFLLSEKNFRDLLHEDDQFYNAHVVEVLYNKFNKDISNPKLKELITEMETYSAPLATLNNPHGKGNMKSKTVKSVIIPDLTGVKANDPNILDFYNSLKKLIVNLTGADNIVIKEEKFKNEITISQFSVPLRTDQIDNIEDLMKDYEENSKVGVINFLLHTEDTQGLVDLVPPKNHEEFNEVLLPYLLILNTDENSFEKYGLENFWKISRLIDTKESIPSGTVHDQVKLTVYLESNNINDFLKLNFKSLDDRNISEHNSGFLTPLVFNVIQGNAIDLIKQEGRSDLVMKSMTKLLDNCLVEANNDEQDKVYKKFKAAYNEIKAIIKTV